MAGNHEAGSFMNSTITALFTKSPDCLPLAGMVREFSPIYGLRDFEECYQAKLAMVLPAS